MFINDLKVKLIIIIFITTILYVNDLKVNLITIIGLGTLQIQPLNHRLIPQVKNIS